MTLYQLALETCLELRWTARELQAAAAQTNDLRLRVQLLALARGQLYDAVHACIRALHLAQAS